MTKRSSLFFVGFLILGFLCVGVACGVGWLVQTATTEEGTSANPAQNTARQETMSSGVPFAPQRQAAPQGVVALRVRTTTDPTPRANRPFEIHIDVRPEGGFQGRVYLMAFRGNVAIIVERPVQPSPLRYDIEYPDNGSGRVFLAQYDGVSVPATFAFKAVSYLVDTWSGDVVICMTPEVSPDTCAVVPIQITVQP